MAVKKTQTRRSTTGAKRKGITAIGKKAIGDLLRRASEDIEVRELLLSDPKKAVKGLGLTGAESTVLFSLRRVALEEIGIDIRGIRSWLRDNGSFASSDD